MLLSNICCSSVEGTVEISRSVVPPQSLLTILIKDLSHSEVMYQRKVVEIPVTVFCNDYEPLEPS